MLYGSYYRISYTFCVLFFVIFFCACYASAVFAQEDEGVLLAKGASFSEVLMNCLDTEKERDSCYAGLCEFEPGYLCAEDLLDSMVRSAGPEKAMMALHDIMTSSFFVIETDGHLLAHVVGRSLSKHFGSSGEHFVRCPHDFNDGCYHGFFENTLTKADDPVEVAISICENMPPETTSEKEKSYCYHGAGHVFLMNESHNLDTAMSYCISVPEDWHKDCLSGVFMENAWPKRGWEEKYKNFRHEDPLYPCNAIDEEFRPTCYIEHYSYLMHEHTTSFDGLVEICSRAGKNVADCLSGIGVMLQNSQYVDILAEGFAIADRDYMEKIIFLCDQFPDRYKDLCYAPLIGSILNFDYPDVGMVVTFCSNVVEDHRSVCFKKIGSYLNHLGSDVVKKRACMMVPEMYQSACLLGDALSEVYVFEEVLIEGGLNVDENRDESPLVVLNMQEEERSSSFFIKIIQHFQSFFNYFFIIFTQSVSAQGLNTLIEERVFDENLFEEVKHCLVLKKGRAMCYASLCEYEPGYLCAEDIVVALTFGVGPVEAISALHDITWGGYFSFEPISAHKIAHAVGRMAGERFGLTGEVFVKCPTDFDYGCHHGFFEAGLGAFDVSAGFMEKICESMSGMPPYAKTSCYHGFGHVLVMNYSYDLYEPLGWCDMLEQEYQQQSCYSGVFMENVAGAQGRKTSGKVDNGFRNDDPIAPCNRLAERYKASCYQSQVSYWIHVLRWDLKSIIGMCGKVGKKYIGDCAYNLGAQSIYPPVQDLLLSSDFSEDFLDKTVHICNQLDEQYRVRCYEPAIDQSFSHYGVDVASEFCGKVDEKYQLKCWQVVGRNVNDKVVGQGESLGVCGLVSEEYRGDCLGSHQSNEEDAIIVAGQKFAERKGWISSVFIGYRNRSLGFSFVEAGEGEFLYLLFFRTKMFFGDIFQLLKRFSSG